MCAGEQIGNRLKRRVCRQPVPRRQFNGVFRFILTDRIVIPTSEFHARSSELPHRSYFCLARSSTHPTRLI